MDRAKVESMIGNIRLIALDLDGTTLTRKAVCTPRTQSALQNLIDAGYIVVPVTGRKYPDLLEKIEPVCGVEYAVSANGAMVTECAGGKRLWEKLIPNSVAARFVDEVFVPGNHVYTFGSDKLCTMLRGCTSIEFYEKYVAGLLGPAATSVGFITEGMGDKVREQGCDIAKIGLWFSRPDGFEYYENRIAEDYPELTSCRISNTELEFMSSETDKGKALKFLTEYLGLEPWQVCAAGDSGNDIPMLEYAGLGVAMGNASDEAKASADIIIGRNIDDGLAAFFEEFFL